MLRLDLTQLQQVQWAVSDILWYYSGEVSVYRETYEEAVLTLKELGIEVDL